MEGGNKFFASVSRHDWSFDRRGARDEARHDEKVKESIKGNLGDVVSDGNIITADPNSKKIIKVPLKSLELPRFKFGDNEGGVGTGSGDGDPQEGESVDGDGTEAGDQPGVEYYEAEMTIEEIQALVFEDLGLPNMKERGNKDIYAEEVRFDDIRKKRTTNNLDLGRTVLENIMRNARENNQAKIGGFIPDDYRVRTWEEEMKPKDSAVVIAMADISASMGDFEKYITRAFCWWSVSFLRTKYPSVDLVFISHDTEAHEVTEEQFFTRGSGGGTKCSSANKMALDIIHERYSTDQYNVYPLHFSDGDNWTSDNEISAQMVNQMLGEDINQYAYIQIDSRGRGRSSLFNEYEKSIDDERYKGLFISNKDEVLDALKTVFNTDEE